MRTYLLFLVTILALLIAGCNAEPPRPSNFAATRSAPHAADISTIEINDPELIEGKRLYDLNCAHCHGYNLEGQIPESIPATLELGMKPVPAPGPTGHFWEHPDQLLLRVVQEGISNPLDQYPMAAFGNDLSEAQIRAILGYIKLSWTDEQRAYQARLTEDWAARTEALGLSD